MDFIKGILFLVIYINALATLGRKAFPKQRFFHHLVGGYMIFYAISFFIGFTFQLLNLPVMIYHYLTGIGLLLLTILSFKDHPNNFASLLVEHFKTYYLVYLVSFVLLFLSVMYYPGHMLSNNVDDGYYVMKIINFVKGINVNIDPATGFVDAANLKTKLARIVNTCELDLSSYCYLFKIDVLVFVNYIYTWFNYYFILAVIVTFFEEIFDEEKNLSMLVTGIVGVLFFAMYPKYFDLLRVYIQDAWQFNTAIWYGSSITRIPALFILFYGIFYYQDEYLKQVVHVLVCAIVLMSKGTQILPILVMSGFIYTVNLIAHLNISKYLKIMPIPVYVLASIVLDHFVSYTQEVGMNINSLVSLDIKSPVMLALITLWIGCMVYYRKNQKLFTWNLILCFFMIFSLVDPINDVLTTFSIYYFVAARATTLIFFTVVLTTVYELVMILRNYQVERLLKIGSIFACLLFSATCFIYIGKNAIHYIAVNPKLTYQSIVDLSHYLQQLDDENGTEEVRVVAPALYMVGKNPITPSSNLRYYANDITVISLEPRYSCNDENNSVSYYTKDVEEQFECLNDGDITYFDDCFKVWEKTDANTVILNTKTIDSQMNEVGYHCIQEIQDLDDLANFYVYYKE